MSDLTNQLLSLFGQNEISAISNQIGADDNQTSEAIQKAVPTLLSALQNNVSNGGADGLLSALDRDHDGSILDDVMGFFQGGGSGNGDGILKHLLGDNKGNVENALASNTSSGISAGSIAKLLPLIAPIIMGFLGKQKQQNGVADEGGISSLIGQFIVGGNAKQEGGQTNSGSGIMDTISKLFRKYDMDYTNLQEGIYAEMQTTKGDIILKLEHEKTPLTVANFIGLAEGLIKNNFKEIGTPYYDGLSFHRVIPDFMIQGGCPEGSGRGGPGYKFKDEFDQSLTHNTPGILSMANAGPYSNGSQFFITHIATPWLDGKHSVFGKVIEGQEVVDAIQQGDKINALKIIRNGDSMQGYKATDFANSTSLS